jgi:chemotaxis-related protein WspD
MKAGDLECWKQIGVFGDASCPELATYTHCHNCPVFTAAGRQLMDRVPPQGYRDEWTTLLSHEKPRLARDHSVIVFRIGEEWLALDTLLFVEVARWKQPHRIAHRAHGVLAGLVNIRGQLQLCAHLGTLLRIGPRNEPPPTARILVIARHDATWALIADEVHGVHFFSRDAVEPAPAAVGDGSHLRGVLRWNDKGVGYLDGDALFAALAKAVATGTAPRPEGQAP